MMRIVTNIAAITIGFVSLAACQPDSDIATTTSSGTGSNATGCPGSAFSQQAVIFDALKICATNQVPTAKLRHAANVAAEWLDNNGDGQADDPKLIMALKQNNPVLVMTKSGPSNALIQEIEQAANIGVLQDLGAHETAPSGGRRDASQEEIHHLILNAGWAKYLPGTFASQPGSKIYGQWQLAEQQGNYRYNDPTCDASCKTTEFFYLATAAYLGSAADLASDEMRLKNRAQLASSLPETVSIIQSKDYVYPTDHWPTGTYQYQQNIKYGS